VDIGSRFSLVDFLAYLFPGVFGLLGMHILLLLTPAKDSLIRLPIDLTTGVLFLALSYVAGVVMSGFSEVLPRMGRLYHSHTSELLPGLENELTRAFQAVFRLRCEGEFEWSRTHFYLCRSIIYERMPCARALIQRQSGLRQLRMNLIVPVLIWLAAGVGWGAWSLLHHLAPWGIMLIIASPVVCLSASMMIVNRMRSNDRREQREVLVAFLSGYKGGMLLPREGSGASSY
jgi:hypothetical protein